MDHSRSDHNQIKEILRSKKLQSYLLGKHKWIISAAEDSGIVLIEPPTLGEQEVFLDAIYRYVSLSTTFKPEVKPELELPYFTHNMGAYPEQVRRAALIGEKVWDMRYDSVNNNYYWYQDGWYGKQRWDLMEGREIGWGQRFDELNNEMRLNVLIDEPTKNCVPSFNGTTRRLIVIEDATVKVFESGTRSTYWSVNADLSKKVQRALHMTAARSIFLWRKTIINDWACIDPPPTLKSWPLVDVSRWEQESGLRIDKHYAENDIYNVHRNLEHATTFRQYLEVGFYSNVYQPISSVSVEYHVLDAYCRQKIAKDIKDIVEDIVQDGESVSVPQSTRVQKILTAFGKRGDESLPELKLSPPGNKWYLIRKEKKLWMWHNPHKETSYYLGSCKNSNVGWVQKDEFSYFNVLDGRTSTTVPVPPRPLNNKVVSAEEISRRILSFVPQLKYALIRAHKYRQMITGTSLSTRTASAFRPKRDKIIMFDIATDNPIKKNSQPVLSTSTTPPDPRGIIERGLLRRGDEIGASGKTQLYNLHELDVSLGVAFVLKENTPDTRDLFLRELRALGQLYTATLTSSNFFENRVKTFAYSYDTKSKTIYSIMEKIHPFTNQELATMIRTPTGPPRVGGVPVERRQLNAIIQNICYTFLEFYKEGIILDDLKGENIGWKKAADETTFDRYYEKDLKFLEILVKYRAQCVKDRDDIEAARANTQVVTQMDALEKRRRGW